VLSAIVRVRAHSSATIPLLSSTHGRRTAYEELRIREAGHRVKHRGPALRPADPQRERAESSGRERACRRLFVGFACRGLPQGTPRMIRPIGRSSDPTRHGLAFSLHPPSFELGPGHFTPIVKYRLGANSAVFCRALRLSKILRSVQVNQSEVK